MGTLTGDVRGKDLMDIKFHHAAEKEIRKLAEGAKSDKELVAIIGGELQRLRGFREAGQPHPKEKALGGGHVSGLCELVIYMKGNSARVYFGIWRNTLWVVGLNPRKSRTSIQKGFLDALIARFGQIREGIQ